MAHNKSLIRTKYAVVVLGIAADAPTENARRLLASLASEYAHPDTPPEIIEAEAWKQAASSFPVSV